VCSGSTAPAMILARFWHAAMCFPHAFSPGHALIADQLPISDEPNLVTDQAETPQMLHRKTGGYYCRGTVFSHGADEGC